ncbi:MAG: hypothetical protein JXB32_14710 [Deltaproteobacteria bacterium]|nr:hypothetical protein [Deltaproteobacteria bacterium]
MQWIRRSVWILALAWGAVGCDESSPSSDAADESSGDVLDGADGDADGDADADDVPDGADGDADGDADADACTGTGVLGELCVQDCDCTAGLRCLGLPGETVCSTPCIANATCIAGTVADCDTPFCELTLGACRCRCLGPEDCPGEQCSFNYCVACTNDEHCAGVPCGAGTPRCRPDTGTCVCGGACGDGTCDEVESAILSCPADCTGPCTDGESHPWGCWDGTLAPWCRCESEAWVCEPDPAAACSGDTECQRGGGSCVPDAASCYEGTILAEPLGCAGDSPLCCLVETCTGPGDDYYPGSGHCCPGLIALSSLGPMEGMLPDGALACMPGCWSLTCTPCGDGTCELHLGENFCNCPRDCPAPDYDLSCTYGDGDCGLPYCRMEGDVCHQVTPRCTSGSCSRETEGFPGRVCDCATRGCVAG